MEHEETKRLRPALHQGGVHEERGGGQAMEADGRDDGSVLWA